MLPQAEKQRARPYYSQCCVLVIKNLEKTLGFLLVSVKGRNHQGLNIHVPFPELTIQNSIYAEQENLDSKP